MGRREARLRKGKMFRRKRVGVRQHDGRRVKVREIGEGRRA